MKQKNEKHMDCNFLLENIKSSVANIKKKRFIKNLPSFSAFHFQQLTTRQPLLMLIQTANSRKSESSKFTVDCVFTNVSLKSEFQSLGTSTALSWIST